MDTVDRLSIIFPELQAIIIGMLDVRDAARLGAASHYWATKWTLLVTHLTIPGRPYLSADILYRFPRLTYLEIVALRGLTGAHFESLVCLHTVSLGKFEPLYASYASGLGRIRCIRVTTNPVLSPAMDCMARNLLLLEELYLIDMSDGFKDDCYVGPFQKLTRLYLETHREARCDQLESLTNLPSLCHLTLQHVPYKPERIARLWSQLTHLSWWSCVDRAVDNTELGRYSYPRNFRWVEYQTLFQFRRDVAPRESYEEDRRKIAQTFEALLLEKK